MKNMTKRLESLIKIDSGGAFESKYFNQNKGIPLVRIRNVATGISDTLYDGDYEEKYIINDGDYLITMDGEFKIRQWKGGKALLNQRVCRVLVKNPNTLVERYLYYFLPKELKDIEDRTPFATVKHLSVKDILNIIIPLPPIETQKKIAAVLDKAQELINKRKQQIAMLDEFIQSVFIDMFGDPASNPKGWEIKKLCTVLNKKAMNGFYTSNDNYDNEGNAQVIWISDFINKPKCDVSNLKKANTTQRYIDNYRVSYGDVLFCRSSLNVDGIGKASYVPKHVSNNTIFECHIIRVSLDMNIVTPEFFQAQTSLPHFRNQIRKHSKTATMTTISQSGIEECSIIIPPLSFQNTFVNILEKAEQQKVLLEKSLFEMENNFNSIMQRAFKGELF